jgi:hypothetical protein
LKTLLSSKKNTGILIVIIVLVIFSGIITYKFGWYDALTWLGGFIVFVSVTICYIKVFPNSHNQVEIKFSLKSILLKVISYSSMVIPFISVVGYITVKRNFENSELINHGIRTFGIVQESISSKNNGYLLVYFYPHQNERFETNISEFKDFFKKGDTVIVIYSERIPAINRAD